MEADTWSSTYIVDGKVFIGNENGTMFVFAAQKEKKLLKTIEMKGKIRATPVVTNGNLFMITENPCRLYSISKK